MNFTNKPFPDWITADILRLVNERTQVIMSDGHQDGTQPIMGGGATLDERISAASGYAVPPDWTDHQKIMWLKRESQSQIARAAASASINKYQPGLIWPSDFSESDKAAYFESQAKQKKQPDRRAKVTDPRIAPLERQRAILLTYLRSKLDADDMHGVQDAASDIREIDAKLNVLR